MKEPPCWMVITSIADILCWTATINEEDYDEYFEKPTIIVVM